MEAKNKKTNIDDAKIVFLFQKLKNKKTNKEVANILGINPSFISNVKSGKEKLSERIVTEMAKIAGPEITEYWGERCKNRIREQL